MSNEFHARTTDPHTSHLAAANLNHVDLSEAKKLIMKILSEHVLSDEYLVDMYTELAAFNPKLSRSPQSIRTMRNQLHQDGLLRMVGIGTSKAGNPARLFTALEV
jgi:hypothetical protein